MTQLQLFSSTLPKKPYYTDDLTNGLNIAKAEILIPNWRVFTDYFLLLKYEGSWKIVQKSYTWREIPKNDSKK